MSSAARLALPARYRRLLEPRLADRVAAAWYGDEDGAAAVGGADVLWLALWRQREVARLLEAGSELRWISTHSAGVEFLPLDDFARRGIVLTNGAGVHAEPIAEYVLAALLAATRGLAEHVRAHDRRDWHAGERIEARELAGTRALLLGHGGIGRAIEARVGRLGVATVGVRRSGSDGALRPGEWRARLADFDWVILSAPLTPETRGMIGAAELDAMRETAWLVNVGRGALVDQAALVRALHRGAIGGAVLDVTDPEPPLPDDPLWDAPNVLLTGHTASDSPRTDARAAELFLDNLDRYLDGRPLRNVVDLTAGY